MTISKKHRTHLMIAAVMSAIMVFSSCNTHKKVVKTEDDIKIENIKIDKVDKLGVSSGSFFETSSFDSILSKMDVKITFYDKDGRRDENGERIITAEAVISASTESVSKVTDIKGDSTVLYSESETHVEDEIYEETHSREEITKDVTGNVWSGLSSLLFVSLLLLAIVTLIKKGIKSF